MKKIILLLCGILAFASSAFAQCGLRDPGLGDARQQVMPSFIKEFGLPTEMEADKVKWTKEISSEETHFVTAFFNKGRLSAFSIGAVLNYTPENVQHLYAKYEAFEKTTKEYGFQLTKSGSGTAGKTIKTIYQEYVCKDDKTFRSRIILGKDEVRKLCSVHYIAFHSQLFTPSE